MINLQDIKRKRRLKGRPTKLPKLINEMKKKKRRERKQDLWRSHDVRHRENDDEHVKTY